MDKEHASDIMAGGEAALCLKTGCMRMSGHSGRCKLYPTAPIRTELPDEIWKKIDKTQMTRGAQPYDRVPYQNRVRRWNRAVIPLAFKDIKPEGGYQDGSVIMVSPREYFDQQEGGKRDSFPEDVVIGENAFLFYNNRADWSRWPLEDYGFEPCKIMHEGKEQGDRRKGRDVGDYIARVPATTSSGPRGEKVVEGPPQGIRFFEYASKETCWKIIMQLGYLSWKTDGIEGVAKAEVPTHLRLVLEHHDLADDERLEMLGVIEDGAAVCPLCRKPILARNLMSLVEQQEGREVVDLTVTQANLFHLDDLTPGKFGHKPYSVGWGHHHCNMTARDMGIEHTLDWMQQILVDTGRIPRHYHVADEEDEMKVGPG